MADNGLNPRQFSLSVPLDPSYFSKVLKGKVGLTLEKLEAISKTYNVDLAWLRGSDNVDNVDNVPRGPSHLNEKEVPYVVQRRAQKNAAGPVMVPLVPVSAQAGYSKSYNHTDFLNKLEYYPIVPGIDPAGAVWRYFQVDGESMMDFLHDRDYVLANQILKEDWPELKDYLCYVIVTDDLVTVKYVAKRKGQLILIPRNDKFEQKAVNIDDVREIWKYRRHIGWNASNPKKLEIKI